MGWQQKLSNCLKKRLWKQAKQRNIATQYEIYKASCKLIDLPKKRKYQDILKDLQYNLNPIRFGGGRGGGGGQKVPALISTFENFLTT